MAPRETVVIETSPPAYGTIDTRTIDRIVVHHHHHRRRSSPCCRVFLVFLLIFVIMVSFSAVCFVAWNFYNLSECEKSRLPWEKPCKDWLGKDSVH